MADFFNLNLWMFIVIGVFGYLLCYFRYKFLWLVLPTVIVVCITYLLMPRQSDEKLVTFDELTWVRIGFSMFVALALPIVGAMADHDDRYPRKNNLP